MTRSDRLKPVAQVVEHREQEAARILGEFVQLLDRHRSKLEELIRYRAEYARQFNESGSQGMSAQRLVEYRQFLTNIDHAIDAQREQIGRVEVMLEQKKQQYLAVRRDAQALDKVIERHVKRETVHANRREQRDTDERAQYMQSDPTRQDD